MNNPEVNLLKLFLNYNLYNKFEHLVDEEYLKTTHKELSYIFKILKGLHTRHPNTNFTLDELHAAFWIEYPEADPQIYGLLFERLAAIQISDDIGESLLQQIHVRKTALKLSEQAYKVGQGLADPATLSDLTTSLENSSSSTSSGITSVSTDLDGLLSTAIRTPGLRWRLDFLNKSAGSLRKGDFGYIFARPETGKTTFLASEVSHMFDYTDGHIVWFNNEEQDSKVLLRIYQAYFGVTLEKLLANPQMYRKAFTEQVGDKLQFFDITRCNKKDCEAIQAELNPVLTVYDQLDKFKGFDADREDLKLGKIYQWARELAKTYGAGIGVSQADGSGEGVKYLTMDHCANAKTSKQAEADLIIGIGRSHDQGAEYTRYINICKNKLFGDEDSLPNLRHGRTEVLIKPEIARYQDIIKYV